MLGLKKKQTLPKRNVNRTGANTPVFSYYASRSASDTTTGRLKDRAKQSFDWKLIPSYIALVAIVASLVYVSTLTTNPRLLGNSHQTSAVMQAESSYQTGAREVLQKSIFSRSKLLINTQKLEQEIKARFPELRRVSITIPLISRRPIVAFESAEPALLLRSGDAIYVIDQDGIAILKLASADRFENLAQLRDESGLALQLGKAALPSETTRFINEISRQFTDKKLKLDTLSLPTVANELHVRLKGEGYFIKFNIQGDPRLQAGTYLAVKKELAKRGIKPATYIDVRVEEKAFYK